METYDDPLPREHQDPSKWTTRETVERAHAIMNAFLVSAEESETLRRRAMRFSYHMPSVDVDEAVRLIFRADAEAGGQFTLMQYDALQAITDKAARQAREARHAGT